MKASEYQRFAATTEKLLPHPMRLLHSQIGVCGEAGEIAEIAIEEQLTSHFKRDHMEEEIGDCCWYVAIVANVYGIRFEDIIPMTPTATPMPDLQGWVVHFTQAVGEFADAIKREVIYEKKDMRAVILDKAYQVMFWLQILCQLVQMDLEVCFETNITKLQKRYPELKFTPSAANARADKQ